jgi:membrane-bound lytic murein transglycosylase B
VRLAKATDIPPRALYAYQVAAGQQGHRNRACGLRWEFVAAFARMETDHGRLGGSSIGPDGIARPPILGPPLDGSKPGVIGRLADASGAAVRAAGPLQFIPDTWQRWGAGNVQDIDNAAWAAARYLCADGRDLSTPAGRRAAALAYNNVGWYATDVLAVYADYLAGRPAHSFPVKPGAGAPAPGVKAKRSAAERPGAPAAGSAPSSSPVKAAAPRHSATPTPAPRKTTSAATPTHTPTPPPSTSPAPSTTTSP